MRRSWHGCRRSQRVCRLCLGFSVLDDIYIDGCVRAKAALDLTGQCANDEGELSVMSGIISAVPTEVRIMVVSRAAGIGDASKALVVLNDCWRERGNLCCQDGKVHPMRKAQMRRT